jgi:hypothetical protein
MKSLPIRFIFAACFLLIIFRFSTFAEEAKEKFSIQSIIDVSYPSSFEVQKDYVSESKLKDAMHWLVLKRGEAWFPVVGDVLLLDLRHANEKTTRILFGVSPPVLSEKEFVNASQDSIKQLISMLAEKQVNFDKHQEITVLKPATGQRVTLPSGNTVLVTERTIKKRNGLEKKERKLLCFTDRFVGIVDISLFSDSSPEVLRDIEQVTSNVKFVSSPNPYRYGGFQGFQYAVMRAAENSFLRLLFFASMSVSMIAALLHNVLFRRKHADAPSYFYGYTLGYFLLAWPLCLAINQYVTENASVAGMIGYYLFSAALFSVAGFFCIKRSALGFYFGSILTLNPVFWIISIIYAFTSAKKVWPRKKASPPPLPPTPTSEQLFVVHDGTTQYDPINKQTILDTIRQGVLTQSHFYWDESTQTWKPLSELFEEK